MKKKIEPGQYWLVNYKDSKEPKRSYKGSVRVESYNKYEQGYQCKISQSDPNKFPQALFFNEDFVKQIDEEQFLKDQIKYVLKMLKKLNKKLYNGSPY